MRGDTDVAIVGAGPYALSLAAHLRERRVEFRIFGSPMKFWRDMPAGINLKSFAFATCVWVPGREHPFPQWCRANGLEDFEPCSMASFAAYGMWMKDRFVPELEPSEVSLVSTRGERGFRVRLADGEALHCRRVVFATGLSHFAYTPETVSSLPGDLVSHTSGHTSYARFHGKEVAVIGAGASAIEAAALVHEAGGEAQILVRDAHVVFHDKLKRRRSLYHRLRHPNSVLGPGIRNRAMQALPPVVHFLPEERRVRLVKSYLGPAAPWWIFERVKPARISVRTRVLASEPVGSRVRLRLHEEGRGERTIDVDHVIAGTGFVADVERLRYLDDDFRRRLRRIDLAPALSLHFESSVAGAHFIGPVAAMSFGPLFRFVAGAAYAAPALALHLAGPVRGVVHGLKGWASRVYARGASSFA